MVTTSPQSECSLGHRATFGLAAARHEPSNAIDRAISAINVKLRDGPFGTDGKRVKVRAASMGRNRPTNRKDEPGQKPLLAWPFRYAFLRIARSSTARHSLIKIKYRPKKILSSNISIASACPCVAPPRSQERSKPGNRLSNQQQALTKRCQAPAPGRRSASRFSRARRMDVAAPGDPLTPPVRSSARDGRPRRY